MPRRVLRAPPLATLLVLAACSKGPVDVDVSVFDAGGNVNEDAAAAADAEYPDNGFLFDQDARPDAAAPDAADDSGVPDPDAEPGDAPALDGAPDPDATPGDALEDAGVTDAEPPDLASPDVLAPDAPAPDAAPDGGVADGGDAGVDYTLTWVEHVIDSTLTSVSSVQAVDIDGDQDRDVIAAAFGSAVVNLYVNGGTGATWTTVPIATNIYAMQTAAADLDGDGDLDVAVVGLYDPAAPFASAGQVRWLENPGSATGTWISHPITAPDFYGPRSIAAGDLTGDGRVDLVVGCIEAYDAMGNAQGQGLHWLRNTAAGFVAPAAIDLNLGQVEVVALEDVDADGVLDVLLTSTGNGEADWYENGRTAGQVNDNPGFTAHTVVVHNRAYGLASAELDADAARELFLSYDNGSMGGLITLDAPADPRNPWAEADVDTAFGGGDPLALAAADFNLDGLADLAAASYRDAQLRAYYRDGAGWTPQVVGMFVPGLSSVAAARINGDLRIDLVTCTNTTLGGDSVSWWENQP